MASQLQPRTVEEWCRIIRALHVLAFVLVVIAGASWALS
jgi:hypothetical protein